MRHSLLGAAQNDHDVSSTCQCFARMALERLEVTESPDVEFGRYLDWDLVEIERPRLFPY